MDVASGFNAKEHKWYPWHAASLAHDIVKFPFVIGDAGTHLALERFHGEDFDTDRANMPTLKQQEIGCRFNILTNPPNVKAFAADLRGMEKAVIQSRNRLVWER